MTPDIDLDGPQKVIIFGLIGLVIASSILTPAMLSPDSPPTDAKQGSVAKTTNGFTPVPDTHATTNLGSADLSPSATQIPEPDVQATKGSQTLTVNAYEQDNATVLKLSDDQTHSGRWISVRTTWFQQTLGHVPTTATVQHENGTEYAAEVVVEGNDARFYVEEFSTNTVAFSKIPSLARANISTNVGSQTLQASAVKRGGEVALNLTDNRIHDGRWIRIPTKWYQQALGRVPEVAFIEHESGDRYSTDVIAKGETARFYVEEFSSNTVTFSGDVSVQMDPASDGSQASYDLQNADNVSDYSIKVTGRNTSQWSNESGADVVPGESPSLSVDGNAAPTGPAAGDPELQLTGHKPVDSPFPGGRDDKKLLLKSDDTGSTGHGAIYFNETPQVVSKITMPTGYTENPSEITVSVRIIENERPDKTYNEGTEVASYTPTGGTQTIDITDYRVNGNPITVEFYITSTSSNYTRIRPYINTTASGTWATTTAKDQSGTSIDLSGQYVESSIYGKTPSNISVKFSDGTSVSFGNFTDGETKTRAADITAGGATSMDVTGENGTLDWALDVKEQYQTEAPAVEVNGHWTNYTAGDSKLADGETASLTTNTTWIQNGTNRVNVSTAAGSSVAVNYTHSATDQQSVNYTAEEWSERYNVSKTYSSDRQNVELTIPFAGDILAIRGVEKRVNGGGWQTVSSSNYSLSNTTVTVQLGDVKAGDTLDVRANGSKVQVYNGNIQVTDPTTAGSPLDSTVKITSKQSGFYISYGGVSGRIYYTTEESWSDPATTHYADAQGHKRMYAPNAPDGGTMRVQSIPVTAKPETNEVRIVGVGGSDSEPSFKVRTGEIGGDKVKFTFQNATADTDYILYSKSKGVVRDSGTANSPITLTDDDSEETLAFLVDDGTSSSNDDSSDSVGAVAPLPSAGSGDANWLPLLGVGLALAGVIITAREPTSVKEASSDAGSALASLTAPIPVAGDALGTGLETVTSAAGDALAALVGNRIAAMAIGGAILLGAIQGQIIQLPQGSLVIVAVAAVGVFSGVALRKLGEFSTQRWAGTMLVTGVIGLQVVSPAQTSLLDAVVQSDIFPLLVIFGAIIAYRAIQGLRQPDKVTTVVVSGDSQTQQSGGDAD